MKFDYVVHAGDLFDFYSQSSFPKNPNYFTPLEETEVSRRMAEEMWWKLGKLFKRAKKFQLSGNHGSTRVKKKVLSSCPEVFHFLDTKSVFEFDGVETVHEYRDGIKIEGINFIHGFSSTKLFHAKYFQESVVCGHTHTPSINYIPLRGKNLFEMNVGHLANPFHPFLSYTPLKKVTKWMNAFGIIDCYGPRVITL